MICRLALAASFLLVSASPALAQTHSRPHVPPYPHGAGHVRPDSATHAAMHARLHGNWTGTLSAYRGVSSSLEISVVHDALRNALITLRAERPIQAGAVSDVVMTRDTLQWTQDLSGASCKATAVVSPAMPDVPETMNGKMDCPDGEVTFTLQKRTG
jgi:hypothetical protein